MGRKSSEKKRRREGTSFKEKGDIVERIVASMHDLPGVRVARNVYLPALGKSRRKREIDVLLTNNLAGYLVQIAIECKNEKKAIGAPKIDAFIGKLIDVGIPLQHGIYVSAGGYTSGAIERANEAGIRPLVLTGLTSEGLAASVVEAFQSVVYLLLEVVNINVANKVASTPDNHQMLIFYNEYGQICGSVPDLVWQMWLDGDPPSSIGEHEVQLTIPPHWHQIVNGKIEPVISISTQVRVLGLVVTIDGEAQQHLLVNASDKKIEKLQVDTSFNTTQETYPITTIQTESLLNEFLKRAEGVRLNIGRIRLPRIRLGPTYWPPSDRTARTVIGLMQAFETGRIPDPRPIDIIQIEGTDLQTIWEPIWGEHPAVKNQSDGESRMVGL